MSRSEELYLNNSTAEVLETVADGGQSEDSDMYGVESIDYPLLPTNMIKLDATEFPQAIMTPGRFPLMGCPAEIRVKILEFLLVKDEDTITIDSGESGAMISKEGEDPEPELPSVSILRTCKLINEEGTPILYGQNSFTICLPIEHKQTPHQSSAFFLRPMRWSTIACINTMHFLSKIPAHPMLSSPPSMTTLAVPLPVRDPTVPHAFTQATNLAIEEPAAYQRPQAVFTCTAAHLLSRFTVSDFKYSPKGPDEYVVLSMSNYVSTQVMRAELNAFQRELEEMMKPSEEFLAAMGDDPAA